MFSALVFGLVNREQLIDAGARPAFSWAAKRVNREGGPTVDRDTPILDFYRVSRPTPGNHTYDSVLAMSDQDLEHEHDYVQWLLPTFNPSMYEDAPTLTEYEAMVMRADPQCQERLLDAFDRMLRFWGFRREGDRVLADGIPAVMKGLNHNWLRMTRAISCLRALGHEPLARSFCDLLSGFPSTEASRGHWQSAAYGEPGGHRV